MTLFLDTNILLDALFERKPFSESAIVLLAYGIEGKVSLYASTLSVVNAVYISRHYSIPIKDVKERLLSYSGFITFVDLTNDNVTDKLKQDWADFEDSVQYGSADSISADYIITRNKGDFTLSPIPVLTAEEFANRAALN